MNILIPDSWLREFLDTNATPNDIQKCLSLCGPSVERLHQVGKDWVYDIEVTTNRVDCMSVLGIAREAAAILPRFKFSAELKPPKTESPNPSATIPGLTIKNDPRLSRRVLALKVSGLQVGPSPRWLASRLELVGQRPLNILVDITNYVMWETGHPTHVFDFDRLSTGQMVIREAKKGESITTLDEKTYKLVGGEVIIDDGTGRIIDLPSIMGTSNSVVQSTTSTALFFIEDILASKVRFASMTHNIRTQAATLMEKDVDPELGGQAVARIIQLIRQTLPHAKIGQLIDLYPHPEKPKSISLSLEHITNHIGINLPGSQVTGILESLGLKVAATNSNLAVTPPSWRIKDIQIPEDLIEEIARIYGYHNLPSQLMAGQLPQKRGPDSQFYWESRVKYLLKHLGFTETYTYSLVDHDTGLKLANPLSADWVYLRTSLAASHKKIIADNLGRVSELNFFEIANVYLPRKNDLPEEQLRLILSTTNPDYFRFKGVIETVFSELGLSVPNLNILNDHVNLYWETPLSSILESATAIRRYIPISKFAPIIEDINVTADKPYERIVSALKKISPLIQNVELVDKYHNKLTLRLTFHSDSKQLSSHDLAPLRSKLASLLTD